MHQKPLVCHTLPPAALHQPRPPCPDIQVIGTTVEDAPRRIHVRTLCVHIPCSEPKYAQELPQAHGPIRQTLEQPLQRASSGRIVKEASSWSGCILPLAIGVLSLPLLLWLLLLLLGSSVPAYVSWWLIEQGQ